MPPAPEVSILVPCYNKRDHVEETLHSVFAQTYSNWELIVVDDGSTDGSVDVLRRYEARAKIIVQSNQGASATRERALREARGSYVQYLDADDLLLPTAVHDRVAALERSGADVAYADWQRLRRSPANGGFERAEVVSRRIEDVHADPEIACFTTFWSPPAALLYSRAIVERIGGWSRDLPVIQDARYLFDAAFRGARFVHVPGVSALYREDADASLSRRSRRGFVADVITNADQVEQLWRSRGSLQEKHRAALVACYDYAAREAFRSQDDLFEHCIQALRTREALKATHWPAIAARLKRYFGKRGSLAVLDMLRRPAP